MRIGAVIHSLNADTIRKLDQSKREVEKGSKVAKGDSSTFSRDAKRLSEASSDISIVKARTSHEPEIRMDKVLEVREKIKSGYYNSSEFADKLAEKMIKDLNI